jgi:hypothetical protein
MEAARILAIDALRTLIGLHRWEEQRLRTILNGNPSAEARVQAEFDLERLARTRDSQSDELQRLEAMEQRVTIAQFALRA